MAFLSLTDLIQKVVRRLGQVSGAGAQLYSEDLIADYIKETYQQVRSMHWWDQLMTWHTSQLDGTTGRVVTHIVGAADGFKDVQVIRYGNNQYNLPQLGMNNPNRVTGTIPRYIEPLRQVDDPNNNHLFRVWPLTAVTTVDDPIRVRVRLDPTTLFTTPATIVPFDSAVLINGAAHSFAADDGANPAQVAKLGQAFQMRLDALVKQHNSGAIILDARQYTPIGLDQWVETPW
jgi:hypothetical protein